MERHLISSRRVIVVLIVLIGLLLTQFGATPAKAELPTDGRINGIPWVNSWGAVAVYCVDRNGGHSSYSGGRILVTNAAGQTLLSATEAQINAAGIDPHKDVIIVSSGLYTLYRQPDTYFRLESKPDNEGKTFLGKWHDCVPVYPPANAAPGPVCTEVKEGDFEGAFEVLCVEGGTVCNPGFVLEEFGSIDNFCNRETRLATLGS